MYIEKLVAGHPQSLEEVSDLFVLGIPWEYGFADKKLYEHTANTPKVNSFVVATAKYYLGGPVIPGHQVVIVFVWLEHACAEVYEFDSWVG